MTAVALFSSIRRLYNLSVRYCSLSVGNGNLQPPSLKLLAADFLSNRLVFNFDILFVRFDLTLPLGQKMYEYSR